MSDLANLFRKFTGREVKMTEIPLTTTDGPKTIVTVSPEDNTIHLMKQTAAVHNVKLVLQWEGAVPRVPVSTGGAELVFGVVEKGNDGKWRVGTDFKMS